MKNQITQTIFSIIFLIAIINLASAIVVDADYITIYSGEQGRVKIEVENNFNYDIKDVSVALVLDNLPFTSVGSSEKDLDDLDENDDDTVTFILKASTDITPGDYNIPYTIWYINAEDSNATAKEKTGSFGLRVSAKTEIDFTVETKDAIVEQQGKISLKIINKGLGDIKFVSVKINPQGYELISSDKIYIGTIDSDDSDYASFDVIFKSTNPTLSAEVEYKDFDNNAKTETVNILVNVYTREKALELGLIQNPNYIPYFVVGGILILWYVIRKVKKRNKKNKLKGGN